jgi:hypothetical protein
VDILKIVKRMHPEFKVFPEPTDNEPYVGYMSRLHAANGSHHWLIHKVGDGEYMEQIILTSGWKCSICGTALSYDCAEWEFHTPCTVSHTMH